MRALKPAPPAYLGDVTVVHGVVGRQLGAESSQLVGSQVVGCRRYQWRFRNRQLPQAVACSHQPWAALQGPSIVAALQQ